MSFGLPPFWTQALKPPFPNRPNRNCSFLLFLFLPAMAIQGFFFAHFLPKTGLPVWGSYMFLLLWKGCIPGPHDFASVSGFTFLVCSPTTLWVPGCSGPPGRTLLHLTCLPLVSHSPAWFYTCLPFVSHVYFMFTVHMEYALPAVNFQKKNTFHQNLQQLFLELQIIKHIQKW